MVIDDQVVGILHRVPANVLGDGVKTIRELVELKNQNPLRGKGYVTPLEKINLGENEAIFLKQQNKNFDYVPLAGETVYLRENSNISTGGDSIDYTDDIPQKFKDIAVNGKSPLKVIASDVTNKKLLVLPDDLKNYNIDPLEFEIAKAVRMSISIPFYFNPVILKYGKESSYIVDGGIFSNFPIWLFDVDGIPKWPTFGLKLLSDNDLKKTSPNKSNLITYSCDIVDTLFANSDEGFLKNKDSVRTIKIRTYNIGTVDFAISKEQYLTLFNSGYVSAKKFLSTWNFNSYISRYRKLG